MDPDKESRQPEASPDPRESEPTAEAEPLDRPPQMTYEQAREQASGNELPASIEPPGTRGQDIICSAAANIAACSLVS